MHTRDIVAVSVVLGLLFVSIMFVVAKSFFVHQRPTKAQNDERSDFSVEPLKRRSSTQVTGGTLKKLFSSVRVYQLFLVSSSSVSASHGSVLRASAL